MIGRGEATLGQGHDLGDLAPLILIGPGAGQVDAEDIERAKRGFDLGADGLKPVLPGRQLLGDGETRSDH